MSACYRTENGKFEGSTEEDWSQALCDYEDHFDGLNPTCSQKLWFLGIMFKGDTNNFFKNEVKHLTSWPKEIVVLSERYNSHSRRRAIIDEIRSMKLDRFMNEAKHEGEALQMLARRIERLVP